MSRASGLPFRARAAPRGRETTSRTQPPDGNQGFFESFRSAMTDNTPHLLLQTRRHFFRDCALGVGSMALASLLNEGKAAAAADPFANPLAPKKPHFTPRAKAVIYLFMA